jgi:hypothetical protein
MKAHRSTLGVIEHAAGGGDGQITGDPTAAHVKIVPQAGRSATPPEEDALPTRPGWHFARPSFPRPGPPEADERPKPTVPDRPPVMNPQVARLIAAQARRAGQASQSEAAPEATAGPEPGRAARRPVRLRSAGLVGAAAAALVVAAGVGIVVESNHGPAGRAATSTSTSSAGRSPAVRERPPAAPSTTIAPPPIVASSTGSDYAAYTVPSTALHLQLVSSSACWVQLRSGSAGGTIVYEGTLLPGAEQTFQLAGSLWLRLGNPAGMRLSVDGQALALPTVSNPFDLSVTVPA